MNLQIRKAAKEDASTIAVFNINMAFETEKKVLPEDIINEGVRKMLETPSLGFYLVAEVDGQIVGSLMVTTEWSDWRNGMFWWIQSVYVTQRFRKQGIYRSLYKYVKQLADGEENVCGFRLYVEKQNTNAQETYKKLGMSETEYYLYEEES